MQIFGVDSRKLFLTYLLGFFVLAVMLPDSESLGQQLEQPSRPMSSDNEPIRKLEVHGVVTQRKKYSMLVRSGAEEYRVQLPATVPISRELIRPRFDFDQAKITMTLPCTGQGGDQSKNLIQEFDLPIPTYLLATFGNPDNLAAFRSGRVETIANYTIHKTPQDLRDGQSISGMLRQGEKGLVLESEGKVYPVKLGTKVNLLSGFSILDLEEGSEVSFQANREDDKWIAQSIQFQKTPTASGTDLPRVLSLGDMVSFSYQRSLHEALADRYQVIHPPTNCGGSKNWRQVNRWLGDYSNQKWDVILFNAGMLDSQTGKDDYQGNLRKWFEALEPAANQVIWLTTTPIQKAMGENQQSELIGKVPGRMKLQNEWAAEVLLDFPKIKTCDLWQVVQDGRESEFKDWWQTTRPQFNYRQSKAIAAAIVECLTRE